MITPHFPPEFGWYGTGRDSLELAHVLADRGHQVTTIACAEQMQAGETFQDGCKVIRVEWQKRAREGSMTAHYLPRARLLMNMNLSLWQAYLNLSKEIQFDIVDISGSFAESLIPALLADTPVFSRIYESQPYFLHKELSTIGDTGFSFERQLKDILLAISTNFGSASIEEIKDSKLHYCLDTDRFSPEGPPAIDSKGKPTVLAHTSIGNAACQSLLVEVFTKVKEEIPDLFLIVVAHDIYTESSEAEMKKDLSSCGIECDMVINRNMSRLLMPGLWRSSNCGLVLDWQDFAPQAVLEPLACARPVMANTKGINTGFLKDPSILTEPREFTGAAIAEKLIELLKNDSLARSMGEKARQYVLEHHCSQKMADQLIQSYQSTIEGFSQKQRLQKIERLEKLLAYCQFLSDSLDRMIYDFLFLHSVRFRLSHWLRKLKGQAPLEPTEKVSK